MSRLLLLLTTACVTTPGDAVLRFAPPVQTPVLDLEVGALIPGETTTWTIRGLDPGESVTLLRAATAQGPGPCFAIAGGLCLDIQGGVTPLGAATADAQGVAHWHLTLPPSLALPAAAFQAVARRGAGGANSVKSQAVVRQVGAAVCGDARVHGAETCDDGGDAPGDGCDAVCQIEACPEIEVGRWVIDTGVTQATASLTDGGVIIGGLTPGALDGAAFARIDTDTWTSAWTRRLTTAWDQETAFAAPTADGDTWIVTTYDQGGYYRTDGLAHRVDAAGRPTGDGARVQHGHWWDELVAGAAPRPDGGVIVWGRADEPTYHQEQVGFTAAYDVSGARLWSHNFEGQTNGRGQVLSAASLPDGGALVAGWTSVYALDSYVGRVSAAGATVWARRLDAGGGDLVHAVTALPDGRAVIAGVSDTGGGVESWVAVLDAQGTVVDGARFEPAVAETEITQVTLWPAACDAGVGDGAVCDLAGARCAASTADTTCACDGATWSCAPEPWTLLLAGHTDDAAGAHDQALVAMTLQGDVRWARAYGGADDEVTSALRVGPLGEVELAGPLNDDDVVVVRTDITGDLPCGATDLAVASYPFTPARLGTGGTSAIHTLNTSPIGTFDQPPPPAASVACADGVCAP